MAAVLQTRSKRWRPDNDRIGQAAILGLHSPPIGVAGAAASPTPPADDNASQPIGVVLEIAGSGSQIALDLQRLNECAEDADPSIALAGQVGSQIKIRVGDGWLLANVRNQRQDRRADGGIIVANIDFLGEGDEERLTGTHPQLPPRCDALSDPRRDGLSRDQPTTCGRSTPATAAPAIEIGTVYPDQRYPRRPLYRCDAGQAFRAARLDRYRQIDQRRADPAPHLRSRAARAIS